MSNNGKSSRAWLLFVSLAWFPCALAAPVGVGASPGSAEPAVDQLIAQLGDKEFARREEASRRLAQVGEPALNRLRQAARSHRDAEVRSRARSLAELIDKEVRGELLVFGSGASYWLNRVAFTADGRHAVATGGAVILYDLQTGAEIRRYSELSFARCGLALTRDGRYFVTGHQHDRNVHLGEVQSGRVLRTFTGHTAGVYAVALSPDESQIVSGGDDRTLRLWDRQTGKEVRQFDGVTDMIRAVAFSPDGRRVAAGTHGPGKTGLVRLWDVASGKPVRSFAGHTGDVTAVQFTPDGRWLVSTGMEGAVMVWDLETGKEVRHMTHKGGVYGAAMSPDGRRLLTAGFGDFAVRLWDVGSGQELRRFDGHRTAVLGVAFSPDGTRFLSSDAQCTLRLWRLLK